jgi:hypothetical protein
MTQLLPLDGLSHLGVKISRLMSAMKNARTIPKMSQAQIN